MHLAGSIDAAGVLHRSFGGQKSPPKDDMRNRRESRDVRYAAPYPQQVQSRG